jgi:hypothetical protein
VKQVAFKAWLADNYSQNSASTHFSCAKRVEEEYGDLDRHFEDGTLGDLSESLHYSKADEKAQRPNPTKLNVGGNPYNVLNNFKAAVRCYKLFCEQGGEAEVIGEAVIERAAEITKEAREGRQFELERHLQDALRLEIAQLEPGLKIIDGGTELSVTSGNIDILAEDSEGCAVVIELKRGLAKREAIGQIAGYMGDLIEDEKFTSVRGILVAGDFDKSCRSAVRVIPNLMLRQYRFSFSFFAPETGEE